MSSAGWSSARVLPSDDLIEELRRSLNLTLNFLERLCSFSIPSRIWFILYQNGPMRFSELLRCGFTRQTLSYNLKRLEVVGLVRRVNHRYAAVYPEEVKIT